VGDQIKCVRLEKTRGAREAFCNLFGSQRFVLRLFWYSKQAGTQPSYYLFCLMFRGGAARSLHFAQGAKAPTNYHLAFSRPLKSLRRVILSARRCMETSRYSARWQQLRKHSSSFFSGASPSR